MINEATMSNKLEAGTKSIDVCVVTYRRLHLLKKLLSSLDRQITDNLFSYQVIIVDNDRQWTAKAVIDEFEPKNYTIQYAVEPEKNIAIARNRALNLCAADYIATIDDDETAHKCWLLNFFNAAAQYQADILFGRVEPTFEAKTPEYIIKCPVFNRERLPSGSIVGIESYNTANAYFKRSVIDSESMRFNPRFGQTGGEDTHFFDQLKQKGYPAVWCDEAVVFHYYPPERARMRWILQRTFRVGNNAIHIMGDEHWLMAQSSQRFKQMVCLIESIAKTVVKMFKCFLFQRDGENNTSQILNHLLIIAVRMGELLSLFNYRYREYR
jgi:succinoglycan biosynthesis protein ExoM